jgi:DNA mismatch endonuclease, patch repair protein
MTDVVDKQTRSRMMSLIGRKDTFPEMSVRRYLHRAGLRFRLHVRHLAGTPDIVLPSYGAVVFVHGCFWHRHRNCAYTTTPSTRPGFWANKFASNILRDKKTSSALVQQGWRVFTVWECEARDELALDQLFWSIVSRSTQTT